MEESSSLIVHTVGFVLRTNKTDMVIAHEVNDEDNARDVTVIPRRMITKVEYLEVK